MNLHHKRSGACTLSRQASSFDIVLLIYELIASDRAMNTICVISWREPFVVLYDKYQNQGIAAHLMRTFEAGDPVTAKNAALLRRL